jgi:chromosome segregation ATPase
MSIQTLSSQVNEMSKRYESMLRGTANNHFAVRLIRCDMEVLEDKIRECKEGIQSADRIISRMQTENLTLNHILRDASNDHLQQQKERQLLMNNHQILRQELHTKSESLERLRNQINVDQNFIRKCSQLYTEKRDEIRKLMTELRQHESDLMQLEERRERAGQLEYAVHRISAALIVEQHRFRTLVYEFSVPRNVHRWAIIAAVDPGYVKNIRFRTGLSAKIDAAHRQLRDLTEEKERLKKQLIALKATQESKKSKNWVISAIDAYKDDIRRMNKEMIELEERLHERTPLMGEGRVKIIGARTNLTKRRSDSAILKCAVSDMKSEYAEESVEPYFITEAPVYRPMLGGGFAKEGTRRSMPIVTYKVGPATPPVKKVTKSYLSPYFMVKGSIRAAPRYFGHNVMLPAYE